MKNYKEKPLLSVIVPVYNVEDFVGECLLSIIQQDYPNIEIIAVNDGSKDHSLDKLKDFVRKYECITVYDKSNGGLSDTRNYALDRCNGEYITFIDSDDVLLNTDIYSKIIELFECDEKLDVVQYDLIYRWNSLEEYKRVYPQKDYINKEELLYGYLKQWIHVSCCDKVFRRNVFENIRFPIGEISEDIAIIPQLVETIGKLKVTKIGYYGYRYREGSITTAPPNVVKIFSILRSYDKYLSCCMNFSSTRPLAIASYSKLIWTYSSVIRQFHSNSLSLFYNQPFFQKITFKQWVASLDNNLPIVEKIKSFIVCIMGPQCVVFFQNLFTRNE